MCEFCKDIVDFPEKYNEKRYKCCDIFFIMKFAGKFKLVFMTEEGRVNWLDDIKYCPKCGEDLLRRV